MKFAPFELPRIDNKGQGREEKIALLEDGEKTPVDHSKLAQQFYDAMKLRDSNDAKKALKLVSVGKRVTPGKLYEPEAQFQNTMTGLFYPRFTGAFSSSVKTDIGKIAEQFNTVLAKDTSIEDQTRDKKRLVLTEDLQNSIPGIDSNIWVAKKHGEQQKKFDQYFLGTNDAVDAAKKIDLIEFKQRGNKKEMTFIQVKTSAITTAEENEILEKHQEYLHSFIEAIRLLLNKKDGIMLDAILNHKDEFQSKEIEEKIQKKMDVIAEAIFFTFETVRTVRGIVDYVTENYRGKSEPISIEDVDLFILGLETEKTQEELKKFLPEESEARGSFPEIIRHGRLLEKSTVDILGRYFKKYGTMDWRTVDFYSIIETPNKILREKKLLNPLREYEENTIDKLAA